MNIMKPFGGLSPFESYLMSEKSAKHASGTVIAGITVASVAAAAAIGAWGGTAFCGSATPPFLQSLLVALPPIIPRYINMEYDN